MEEKKGEAAEVPGALSGMWRFDPSHWDGTKWVSSKDIPSTNFTQQELTIVSYNVWFGRFQMTTRMLELGRLISSHEPDLVALQEVTPEINAHLLGQPWAKKYFVSDPAGKELAGYGVMIMSKHKFHELGLRDFPSRLGRKALIGTFSINESTCLAFGTFHLESYQQDHELRREQMALLRSLTVDNEAISHVILCGDTNFSLRREKEAFGPKLGDCWKDLFLADKELKKERSLKGLTFDTITNGMSKEHNRFVAQTRIDRLFYSKENITPVHMEVFGKESIQGTGGKVWPSDHYGIVVKLKLRI